MKRIDSLIALVKSMTKAERKAFAMRYGADQSDKTKLYHSLYQLIIRNATDDSASIKCNFTKLYPDSAFEITVKYLYDLLTDMLLSIETRRSTLDSLLSDVCKARILFERSLNDDALELIGSVVERANSSRQYEVTLLAQKMELEFLNVLDFPDITQEELFKKHALRQRILKSIGTIGEHASLYDILCHRMRHIGSIHAREELHTMSDLVMREFHTFNHGPSDKPFEQERNHRMFQTRYLMESGDVEGAFGMYASLVDLFETKGAVGTAVSASYYVSVLEGILRTLRVVNSYDRMPPFIDRLRALLQDASSDISDNILCIIMQYELAPLLDTGDFMACSAVCDRYRDTLIEGRHNLAPARECELRLNLALIELGTGNIKKAARAITSAITMHDIKYVPLMRTVRLVRMLAYYELGEMELLHFEKRSVSRSKINFAYETEKVVLKFVSEPCPVSRFLRKTAYGKLQPILEKLRKNRYEQQLLSIFDFTAWIESKLTGKTLSEVLREKMLNKR